MSTLRLMHYALLLKPACWKSSNTNARLMAFAFSLALDPTFEIRSHKTLDTAQPTLRAPLSGTFLQTLPLRFNYVTEGHSFFVPRICPLTCQRLPKGLGTSKTGSNIASKHARKHNNNNVHLSCAHQRPERSHDTLSLIHIWRCRRAVGCRSRWSPYH